MPDWSYQTVFRPILMRMPAASRVLFMEKGQVRFSGPAAELAGRDDLLRSVFLGAAS